MKVRKSCGTAKKITRFFAILMIAAFALCVIGTAATLAFRSQIDTTLAENADRATFDNIEINGILSFRLKVDRLVEAGEYGKAVTLYCVFGMAVTALIAGMFHCLNKTFITIETSESPFTDKVLKTLKTVFILFTVMAGLFCGVVPFILIGVACWSVYCIMDYGITLQEEIDETV